ISFKPLVQPANRYILGFSPVVKDDVLTNKVDSVSGGSPAQKNGIIKGDIIVGLDDKKVESMIDIKRFMSQNRGNSVKVTIKRDGKVLSYDITPQQEKNSEFYESFLDFTHEQGNVFKAAGQSFANTWSFSRLGIYSIGWMLQGRIPFTQMTGAVGAVDAINTVIEKSVSTWQYVHNLLFVTALISIGLGVSNLLPIPPADGSRLILLLVEAVRRKPLPREKEAVVMLAGFVFMVAIFLFTFFNDIASWGKRI
ncbi:MAG TPA: M50 family metallopeptidase, partial [Clostridia bacterium]